MGGDENGQGKGRAGCGRGVGGARGWGSTASELQVALQDERGAFERVSGEDQRVEEGSRCRSRLLL